MSGRGNWGNWFEFLFSCIGCLVGLGNIWRFPYLCYKNGGGAFLIPYFFFIIVCALPLFFLEMSYAQFSNLGPGRAWILCPLFKGIGFGMVTLTGIISIYYTVILSWTLYYLAMSFSPTLPWSTCGNAWNTDACVTRFNSHGNSSSYNVTMDLNSTGPTVSAITTTIVSVTRNSTSAVIPRKVMLATEEFWENNVLEITSGVEHTGSVRWQLLLCLLAAWCIVFLCLIKGIKSSGKVMYVAATVPYLLLLILLIRGLTLPGAIDGLKFYSWPRLDKLGSFSVWSDAAIQMFYSAGLGWGGITTLASYNDFHNNIRRDAIMLPILDAVTSWFAGCVIFVNLGFMAHATGSSIDEVVSQGPGIAFMVYPEALAQLPLPQLWSVLFFLMLFTVGLDSQIVHVQTLTGALIDCFPRQLQKRKLMVTAAVCVVLFVLGIPCITQGGVYVLQILDWYCASVSVMFLVFMEVVVLTWVYGVRRLYMDVELMLGSKLSPIWLVFWKYITPIVILLIWMMSMAKMTPVKYGDVTYPEWAIAIGWVVALLSILPLPVNAVYVLMSASGSLIERVKMTVKPDPKWVPANPALREEYLAALNDKHVNIGGYSNNEKHTEVEMTSLVK